MNAAEFIRSQPGTPIADVITLAKKLHGLTISANYVASVRSKDRARMPKGTWARAEHAAIVANVATLARHASPAAARAYLSQADDERRMLRLVVELGRPRARALFERITRELRAMEDS